MLGRWVHFAAVSDPRARSYFGKRGVVTGNPVRPEFKSIPPKAHAPPYTILIFGGSQGAQSINRAVMEALGSLADWKDRLRFVHQTGEAQLEEVKRSYASMGFDADVRAFFNDFHRQYAAADLIVSRSGATTVAEIKAAGRAAILIPFPFAADDHQTKNARAMADERAAVLIPNAELSGERLAERPEPFEGDRIECPAYRHSRCRAADCEFGGVMFNRIKHVHFVGIGGIGMSGIAEVLLNLGYKVTGSDLRATAITDRLEQCGATVYPRHAAANVAGAHVVVTSSAVPSDNPEIAEAHRGKIPVIARAEMLAELGRLKYAIAVAG
ncbi:MAG: hypothetical protein HYU27_06095, partial [Acidobacteria bacterium]|nr:hypothetical protein [Acidobacteriota bacterium]